LIPGRHLDIIWNVGKKGGRVSWRSTMKTYGLRRLLASGLILVLALSAAGCWNPFAPPEGDDPPPVKVSYKLRTSPENVLYNLKTAYIYRNIDEYVDCLAEEFEFHLSPEDTEIGEWWGKQTESDIHAAMFDRDSNVERIELVLTDKERYHDEGELPLDPMDDRWHCWEGTDLRVTVIEEFIFRIDPLEVGPEGETLYEVIEWWDLEDSGGTLRVTPGVERVTFGGLKALYR
jgi:hypothetical protein